MIPTNLKERTMTRYFLLVAAPAFASSLFAEPVVLKSNFDSTAGPNQYEVNFPPQLGGGTLFMPIVGGSFELETDAAAGTARLLTWNQEISPIDIFGKSTGPITVTLDPAAPAAAGTFDPANDQFEVTGTFLIGFNDSELRDLGFLSPIALTATEAGSIYGTGSIGVIRMFLQGGGSVAGSAFTYTCQTSARFEYLLDDAHAQPGDVNHDRAIDISDPVSILGTLFQGGEMACEAAAEVNSDAVINLSDAVYLLGYLFQGGPSPPAMPVACTGN